jgi:hypothetical protein
MMDYRNNGWTSHIIMGNELVLITTSQSITGGYKIE